MNSSLVRFEARQFLKASALLGILVLFLSSCSGTKEATDSGISSDSPSPKIDRERDDEYVDESSIKFRDYIYKEGIKSAQLYPLGNPLSYPIIGLNTGEQLELHFDELGNDLEQYYVRLYHCNSDWTQSDIIEMQYMDGFFSDVINTYDMSFNTLRPYVHYSHLIPNESMRIKASGNYLLVVTQDDDDELPILSRRFMVVDQRVAVEATVRQSPKVEERRYKHLVNFEVHHASFDISNPFRDVKTVILQNNRWDRAITDLKPIFLRDRIMEYRYDFGNDFWAGNEFRQFNISSTRYITEQVTSVYREGDHFVARLSRDFKRSLQGYRTFRDINGKYIVRNTEGFNDITESDYVDVKFMLDWPEPDKNGSFYVYGGLSNWDIVSDFKLRYDYDEDAYVCTAPLKQGFYEYQYVYLADKSDEIDEMVVEGSYFETENDYTILVYFRNISLDYDQLIGSYSFSTRDRF